MFYSISRDMRDPNSQRYFVILVILALSQILNFLRYEYSDVESSFFMAEDEVDSDFLFNIL